MRIELDFKVSIPETEDLFQDLVLAFWRFQGLAARDQDAFTKLYW